MYLAMILFCTTPQAQSCNTLVNTTNIHMTEEACRQDYESAAQAYLNMNVYFVRGGCFNIGTGV